MEKKYVLTEETIKHYGHTLHRIQAVRSFGNVKEGDLGGFVKGERNLSHEGTGWIYGNAKVCGNARVCGNAKVYGNAEVYGDVLVWGNAEVCGNAKVYGNAEVYGDVRVWGNAEVCGNAKVYGDARVYGNAEVYGDVLVWGNAEVCGNAKVCGNARVWGNADYIVFKNWWSSGRYFTWTRSNNKWKVGCFYGSGEELVSKAYKDSEVSGREYERVVKYVESILTEENAK